MVPRYGRPFTRTGASGLGEPISSTSDGALRGAARRQHHQAGAADRHPPDLAGGISASRAPDGSLTLRPAVPDTESRRRADHESDADRRLGRALGGEDRAPPVSAVARAPAPGPAREARPPGVQLAIATAASAADARPTTLRTAAGADAAALSRGSCQT